MPFDLKPFTGIFPAALTFFDADGELDIPGTIEHCRWLIERGAEGLVIAGTSGEFISLTNDERMRLCAAAADEFGGRLPLIAGSGHASTKLTIEMSRETQRQGYDALIVILPYYSRAPMESVEKHFRAVRAATDLPIMLYNNPNNTACPAFSSEQIAGMVEQDVVHMVKSTMESVTPIHDLSLMVGDRMRIFYGSFLSAFEGLAAGAHGWISGVLNVATVEAVAMRRSLLNGNLEAAREQWNRILPIVHLYTYRRLGPAADLPTYRAILEHWGRRGGYSREPFSPLDEQQIQRLVQLLVESNWSQPSAPLPAGGTAGAAR